MNSLQHSVDNIFNWTEQLDKTKFMLVTTKKKKKTKFGAKSAPHTIKSDVIEEVQNHTVLGITIDNNLSWTPHINVLCTKISTKVSQLSRLKHFVKFPSEEAFLYVTYTILD